MSERRVLMAAFPQSGAAAVVVGRRVSAILMNHRLVTVQYMNALAGSMAWQPRHILLDCSLAGHD
jgi:hypothetical protein